jgi:alpha-D-ribose 1-methylphosphonate 5-triphosphate diphosphatase PhnM
LGDVDAAPAAKPVDFLCPGDGRAAFADVLADASFEIADFARVLAVPEAVFVASRRPAPVSGLNKRGRERVAKI